MFHLEIIIKQYSGGAAIYPKKEVIMKLKAIIMGVITDISLTIFFSIIIAVMIMANKADYHVLEQSIPFLIINMFIGLLCTSIGGYVTAHLAKELIIKNAFYFGIASLLISILLNSSSAILTWYSILGIILTIPFALLGGYLEKRTKESSKNHDYGERNGNLK